jgi:hypothetical protein
MWYYYYYYYYYYYCIILITVLQVSPTYKSQHRRFSLINRYVPCNMIVIDFKFFFVILYNAETWPMWKIYSVPCDSTLNKFYCIRLPPTAVSKWLLVEVFRSVGYQLGTTFVHGVCCVTRIKTDTVCRLQLPPCLRTTRAAHAYKVLKTSEFCAALQGWCSWTRSFQNQTHYLWNLLPPCYHNC